MKEVLRVRPALTIAPRRLLEPARIGGLVLPAGVHVAACLWLALRREDLWPDAAAFRPERWLEGRRRTRRRGSRSAEACAAAPERRSPRWRCARCCEPRPT